MRLITLFFVKEKLIFEQMEFHPAIHPDTSQNIALDLVKLGGHNSIRYSFYLL